MELFSLDNKIALVTGGNRGLGLGIAKGFADAGADVALMARNEDQLKAAAGQIEATGRRVWRFSCDLAQTDKIAGAFEDVCAATGGVDILLNAAGITRRAPAEDFSLEDWNAVLNVNLTSMFAMSQAFAKHCIKEGKPGRIINIASLASEAARPTIPAYTAAKGGVKNLTMALAVDWAKYRINVNAIGPGYFVTDLTRPLVENPDFDRWVKEKTPLDRWGQPEDLVGAAVFLASKASDFVTGQTVYVDGGWLANL